MFALWFFYVLVKRFLYFLHSISKILDHLYYHYPEFFFQVDCLFPLHLFGVVGFYLAPSSAVCFSVFSFCLTYCLWSPFHRMHVRSSRCFWCLPPVAKVGSVGCVGFLVEGTSACVLVDEAGSCLSGGQDRVRWCVLGCL